MSSLLVCSKSRSENYTELKEFYNLHTNGGAYKVDDGVLMKWVDNSEIIFMRDTTNDIVGALHYTYNLNIPSNIIKSTGLVMNRHQCISSSTSSPLLTNPLQSAENRFQVYIGSLVVHQSKRGNKIMDELLGHSIDMLRRDFFNSVGKNTLILVFGLRNNKHFPALWLSYVTSIRDKMQIDVDYSCLPRWECCEFPELDGALNFLIAIFDPHTAANMATKKIISHL